MNVRLDIEYDGSEFHGWQRQLSGPTIQALIEDILSDVLNRKIFVYGASRTDSGVHARGQVANFHDESGRLSPTQWRSILNYRLPRTIRILDSGEAPATFHAQKNALAKCYEYRVLNRSYASALDRRVYFHPRPIDWNRVRRALPYFIGKKDFQSFQGAKSTVLTTVRSVHRFDLEEEYPGLYCFKVEGSGFLKQMVRTMVGTVLEAGEGKRDPDSIPEVLAALNRRSAGRTVPASGLCLMRVYYENASSAATA